MHDALAPAPAWLPFPNSLRRLRLSAVPLDPGTPGDPTPVAFRYSRSPSPPVKSFAACEHYGLLQCSAPKPQRSKNGGQEDGIQGAPNAISPHLSVRNVSICEFEMVIRRASAGCDLVKQNTCKIIQLFSCKVLRARLQSRSLCQNTQLFHGDSAERKCVLRGVLMRHSPVLPARQGSNSPTRARHKSKAELQYESNK
jgi:hypothetical protein